MSRNWIILIGVVMVSTILVAFYCIEYSPNHRNENDNRTEKVETVYYSYNVEIRSEINEAPYTIIIPIPMKNLTEPATGMISTLQISSGIAEFNVTNTPYGPGLIVQGRGNISLASEGTNLGVYYDFLSMQNSSTDRTTERVNGNFSYWVYSDFDKKLTLNLHCEYTWSMDYVGTLRKGYCHKESDIYGVITQGWHLINGTEVISVY